MSRSQIEALVFSCSSALLAGECHLSDTDEASPTYLAGEAFLAMVEVAIRRRVLVVKDERESLQLSRIYEILQSAQLSELF